MPIPSPPRLDATANATASSSIVQPLRGTVTHRRSAGKALCFVALDVPDLPKLQCQLVLDRARLSADTQRFKAVVGLLRPGTRVACVCRAEAEQPGRLSVYVDDLAALTVERCDGEPSTITSVVGHVGAGLLSLEEGARAITADAQNDGAAVLAELCRLDAAPDGARAFKAAVVRQSRLLRGVAAPLGENVGVGVGFDL